MTHPDLTIDQLTEQIPALRQDCAALAAENAALRKALAVVVAKADSHPATWDGYIGGTLVEVYLPFSPGELAVMRLACEAAQSHKGTA